MCRYLPTQRRQLFTPTRGVTDGLVPWCEKSGDTLKTASYAGAVRELTRLPKAHLHVHLESTIRWTTLREIGATGGVPVPDHTGDGPLVFDGFRQFADLGALVR